MADPSQPVFVDLGQFTSPEQAMAVIERDQGFDGAVKQPLTEVIGTMSGMTLLLAFCVSAITRARGLYEGVVTEIRSANHPAVFVLMRQLAETVAVVRYVADHPSYATALMRPEKEWKPGEPRRKSIQLLVNHMDKNYATQFKHVYAELSELTHFGSTAVWNAHTVVDDEGHKTVWSSHPRWRDDRTLYIACAQLLELGAEMELALTALVETVKVDAADETKIVGSFFDANPSGI